MCNYKLKSAVYEWIIQFSRPNSLFELPNWIYMSKS
jgi:hypothetical protein